MNDFIESDSDPARSMATRRDDDPWSGRNALFSHSHIDDATAIARMAVNGAYNGHASFGVVAGDTTADV